MSKPKKTKTELLSALSKKMNSFNNPKLQALQSPDIAMEVLNDMADEEIKEANKIIEEQAQKVDFANYIIQTNTNKKSNPKKPNTLNPNFDDIDYQIGVIHEHSAPLFTSTLEQWENLFSKEIQIFKTPIVLKSKITLSDLRLFFDTLCNTTLIKKSKFNKILENVKAFEFNGSIVTANQLTEARRTTNYPNTLHFNQIQSIFKALKVN